MAACLPLTPVTDEADVEQLMSLHVAMKRKKNGLLKTTKDGDCVYNNHLYISGWWRTCLTPTHTTFITHTHTHFWLLCVLTLGLKS